MEKRLPNNWNKTELGNVLSRITNGANLEQFDIKTPNSYPISRIETIANETIDFNRIKYCLPTSEQIEKYLLLDGDILFSHINSDKHLGKTAIYLSEKPLIHGVNLLLLRSNNAVFNNRTLNYLIKYLRLTGCFIDIAQRAVNQSSINQKKLSNITIPLPPLAEQNRIADKLDVLFGQLETIRKATDRIPELIKNFRQQILIYAVTGKLTEQWRQGKEVKEWDVKTIRNLTSKVGSGSTPKGGQDVYKSSGVPLIRSMNVKFGGIDYTGLAFINDDQAYALRSVEVYADDILLNITGASIGRVCLAPKELNGARVNQHVCIIRCNNDIMPAFLSFYLSSLKIQSFIMSENYGVTRQALTKEQILNIEIDLPLPEEQKEIVNRVQSLFDKVDIIEQRYQTLKAKLDNLPQVLLHKAFKGELVEQLPSDGNASDLLHEIEQLKKSLRKK